LPHTPHSFFVWISGKKTKWPFLHIHSTHWIFDHELLSSPKTQGDVKGKEINDVTMIQTNLWDGHPQFQTVCYTICLNSGMVSGLVMEVTRRLLWREQYWFEGKYCCYGKISPVWSLFDDTMYLLQETNEVTQQKKAIVNFSWIWPATVPCLSPVIVALKWSFCDFH
jgi:hypothetical protein